MRRPILYLIVCAAPPAQSIQEFVAKIQQNEWDVCIIATPQATRFIHAQLLTELTGYMVRSDYKLPGEADPLPKADVILVMPETFNTINKWAGGIGDTLAVSILCEALERGTTPIITVPCLKMDLVRHPIFAKSVALLRECGVVILHEPERYPSPQMMPQEVVLAELQNLIGEIRQGEDL